MMLLGVNTKGKAWLRPLPALSPRGLILGHVAFTAFSVLVLQHTQQGSGDGQVE